MHDRIGVTKIGYVDRPLSDIYAIGMDVLNIDIPSRSVFVPISYMKKNTISIMVDFGHQQSQHVQMASKDLLRGKIRISVGQINPIRSIEPIESIKVKGNKNKARSRCRCLSYLLRLP